MAQESEGKTSDRGERANLDHQYGPRFLALSILLPTLLVSLAEAFFFAKNLEVTLAIHGINILLCITIPFLLNLNPLLFQAFSLVSVLRMLNIGMPVFFDLTIYWLPFIYAPVILVAFLFARSDFSEGTLTLDRMVSLARNRLRNTTIRTVALFLIGGVGGGALIGFVEYQILQPERLIPDLTAGSLLLLGMMMFLFVGLGEELVFRYLLQDRMKTVIGPVLAVLLASFIFAMMHSGYSDPMYLLYVFFIGLIFGISYERTRSLLFVIILHGAINFFLFSFFPH